MTFNNNNCHQTLTSSAQLKFSSCLCTFLVVLDDALVHAFVFFLHWRDGQDGIGVVNKLSVFHPPHGFDWVSRETASENSGSSEVDGLNLWFNWGGKRCGDCQDSLNTFTTNWVVYHAKIFSRILNSCIFDDQSSRYLLDTFTKWDWRFAKWSINEFVPSMWKWYELAKCWHGKTWEICNGESGDSMEP